MLGKLGEKLEEKYGPSRSLAEEAVAEKFGRERVMGNRGQYNMEQGINLVVMILVVGILTANLLPMVLNELAGVDTTSWGSAESALFGLLGLFFVLAIVLFVIKKAT